MSTRMLGRMAIGYLVLLSACTSVTPASQAKAGSPSPGAQPLAPIPKALATHTPAGTRFRVKAPDGFSVVFKGNPTTGYEWFLKEGHNTQVVSFVRQRRGEQPAVMIPGSPTADEIFDFKALQAGETVVSFALYRSWEGPQSAIETVSFPVTVVQQ